MLDNYYWLLSMSKKWTRFEPSNYWRLTCRALAGHNLRRSSVFLRMEEKQLPPLNKDGKLKLLVTSLKFCTNNRSWSCCRHKSPKRCRSSIGRQNAESMHEIPDWVQKKHKTQWKRHVISGTSLEASFVDILL